MLIKQPAVKGFEIISGRGCPFNCAFCAEGLSSIHYRFRSPESVLSEIRHLIGDLPRAYVAIMDDTFLFDRRRIEAIAEGLIDEYGDDRRVVWFCEGRVDFISKNEDIFPLLQEAGLVRVQIGIESGNQEILDLYGKGIQIDDIENAVSILKDADIPSIFGNFILGGANETQETAHQSIDFAKRLISLAPGRIECTASILGIYPGTAISRNPSFYGVKAIDPQMLRCISLTHPVAVTEKMGVNEILAAFHEFNNDIMSAYEKALPLIPFPLIRKHIDLLSYGVNTGWSKILLRYPCIGSYHQLISFNGYRSIRAIEAEDIPNMVPRRTPPVIEVEKGRLAVKNHPRKIIFNEMGEKIFELCSGKRTLREISEKLRMEMKNLPPDPFLTKQIIDLLADLDERLLVVFSDL